MVTAYFSYQVQILDEDRVKVTKLSPEGEELGEPQAGLGFRRVETEVRHLHEATRTRAVSGDEVARFGELLFSCLFGPELVRDFFALYDEAQRVGGVVRVELDIPEGQLPHLAALPWELMRTPVGGEHGTVLFATDPNLVLVRRRVAWRRAGPVRLRRGERLRVAVAAASPKATDDLVLGPVDFRRPWEDLANLAAAHPDLIELLPLVEDATADKIDKILGSAPHIFHFIGHGGLPDAADARNGEIILSDGVFNGPVRYSAEEFSEIFNRHRPRLVLLHACEGGAQSTSRAFAGVASQLVQQNIPVVVAMQFEVSNVTARRFAEQFYLSLAKGEPIDHAVQEGRRAIALGAPRYHSLDFATPVVFSRVRDGRLFELPPAVEPIRDGPWRLASGDHGTKVHRYIHWLADRFGSIELRGLRVEGQRVLQLDLDAVYVPLEAHAYVPGPTRHTEPQIREIDMAELFDVGHRIVLTGGPGSGKTTVLLHIVHTLARAIATEDHRIAVDRLGLGGELPLPVFVPLSGYATYLRSFDALDRRPAREYTLASYVHFYLRQHQADFDLPDSFFPDLLDRGEHVILLLDGLDEVPNEAERVRVRQAVEDLVIARDTMRVVVSCRSAAHRGRSALGRDFREVRVRPLDDVHIVRLVDKAYGHLYEHDSERFQRKRAEILGAIAYLEQDRANRLGPGAQALINSPLLLRLLFVVHQNNETLPAKRSELYLMATEAMLQPDYGPDEEVSEAIASSVGGNLTLHRELIETLAFGMHSQGPQQGREIEDYALRAMLANDPRFAGVIDDFVALTRLRGTLLEERLGTYQFGHLAFQEFMTGRYLAEAMVRTGDLPGLLEFLRSGPLLDTWWREPILLMIGYLSVTAPRIAEAVIGGLKDVGTREGEPAVGGDVQIAAVELAAAALVEWDSAALPLFEGTHDRLAGFFDESNRSTLTAAKPKLRAAAGLALGLFGDRREEIVAVDQMEFCRVPAGPFRMGSTVRVDPEDSRRQSLESERLVHEVDLPYDFWIARHLVTNAQFAPFVADGGYRDPTLWEEAAAAGSWRDGQVQRWFWEGNDLRSSWESGPYDYGVPHNLPNHPVVGVCWYEALAYQRWLGRRWLAARWLSADWTVCFPSEAEWEKAARGGLVVPERPVVSPIFAVSSSTFHPSGVPNEWPDRVYPWGDETEFDYCNSRETTIGATSAAGAFPEVRGPYGCEDMVGNVWQWTRTLWGKQRPTDLSDELKWEVLFSYPYDPVDGREDLRPDGYWLRVPRGGSYFTETRYCRCSFRDVGAPNFRFPWDGFRTALLPAAVIARNTSISVEDGRRSRRRWSRR